MKGTYDVRKIIIEKRVLLFSVANLVKDEGGGWGTQGLPFKF